jgi:hypothetical protein
MSEKSNQPSRCKNAELSPAFRHNDIANGEKFNPAG